MKTAKMVALLAGIGLVVVIANNVVQKGAKKL